ncbi:MAG: hypothetical protein CMG55_06870 [Candidatus Marinimicrobia bacterium]|nr:hypothetical protein [Candidatus Neomarinimicrobiota bacterium]|tara:strand:- start:4547 stop:6256 length:1710 start_codon:yes stop_codon:yes gene_type:complete
MLLVITLHVNSCDVLFNTELELLFPVGGEAFNERESIQIRWENINEDVHIFYFCSDFDAENNTPYQLNSSYGTDESNYSWNLPSIRGRRGDLDSCKIYLRTYNSDSYDVEQEDSSGFFSIIADSSYLQIISPNGGEIWDELSTQNIRFKKSGHPADEYDNLAVQYSLDNGNSYTTIYSYVYSDSIYSWEIPEVYVDNPFVKIRIWQSVGFYDYIDESDQPFTISAGNSQSNIINILEPNGGEEWHELTEFDILWNTEGDIGGNEVYIGYSHDGGANWTDVVGTSNNTTNPPYYNWDQTDNDGIYSWTVPNYIDTSFVGVIGIWSVANTDVYKISDAYFTMETDSNFYRIIQPNGGETFQKGTKRMILWESGGDANDVKILYSLFGGDSWYEIENPTWGDIDNDGYFQWDVPSVQGTNDVCKIRIQSVTRDDWFDESDATFTIADTVIFDYDMGFETGESLVDWNFGVNCTVDSLDAYGGAKSAVWDGEGSLSKTVTVNSGVLRFFAKTDSDYYFRFLIDDQDMAEHMNPYSEEWQLVEVPVDAGTYSFQWYWWYSGSSRYLRVDNISFP